MANRSTWKTVKQAVAREYLVILGFVVGGGIFALLGFLIFGPEINGTPPPKGVYTIDFPRSIDTLETDSMYNLAERYSLNGVGVGELSLESEWPFPEITIQVLLDQIEKTITLPTYSDRERLEQLRRQQGSLKDNRSELYVLQIIKRKLHFDTNAELGVKFYAYLAAIVVLKNDSLKWENRCDEWQSDQDRKSDIAELIALISLFAPYPLFLFIRTIIWSTRTVRRKSSVD